jgi:3(or 17)beta-hydroxysteroid dehydrogenase
MGRIEGKIAVVTGGAQGLGESAVKRLTDEGARVILTDMNSATGTATAAEYGATFVAHDVREEEQWEKLMADLLAEYGRLDILVNNAGIFTNCPVDETPVEDFRRVIDINLTGCFLGCKHGVRAMKKNPDGAGGSIINLSSVTGLRGQIGGAAYTASKGGVRLLTNTAIRAQIESQTPIGRMGEANDIGDMVLFLASVDSKYITGAEMVVDGGMTAGLPY